MSCTTYIHNDPAGGSKYIEGTTCFGQIVNYTLTYGQSVCMDDDEPLLNCDGLDIGGDCFPQTPTPTPTSPVFCYETQTITELVPWICPNTGEVLNEIIKKIVVSIYSNYVLNGNHPIYTFTISNGIDTQNLIIQNGQTYGEFVWISRDYIFNGSTCVSTDCANWSIVSAPIPLCNPPTPTNTSTPTETLNCNFAGFAQYVVVLPTPTPTPYPLCPNELVVTDTSFNESQVIDNGTYVRLTTSGSTSISGGYLITTAGDETGITLLVTGGTAPDGNTYALYIQPPLSPEPSGNYNIIMRAFTTSNVDKGWAFFECFSNPFTGGTITVCGNVRGVMGYLTDGSVRFPITGHQSYLLGGELSTGTTYISYSNPCPTPTPTITQTRTPTPTKVYYYYNVERRTCDPSCSNAGSGVMRAWDPVVGNPIILPEYVSFNSYPGYRFYVINQISNPGYYDFDIPDWTIKSNGNLCSGLPCY